MTNNLCQTQELFPRMEHLIRILTHTCKSAGDAQAKTPRMGEQDGSETVE